jgi:hypothetical protein
VRTLRGPILALAAFLPAGSTTAQDSPLLGFHLSADPADAAVIVEVDNKSGMELCGYRDGDRPELFIRLRSIGGKLLRTYHEGGNMGSIIPPDDRLRIPQGHSVLAHYQLSWYYSHFRDRRKIEPARWEAKAFFRVHRCGKEDWQNIESGWERL